jgi:hypothetical protein
VLVGARRRGGELRIQVCDSAPAQGDRSDELAHALAAGLARLAGGRCELAQGGTIIVLPLA